MTETPNPWWISAWKENDAGTERFISVPPWSKTKESLYEELRQCGIEVVTDHFEEYSADGRVLDLKFPSGKELAIIVDGDYCGGHWMECVTKGDMPRDLSND